jgi:hypothetical protein
MRAQTGFDDDSLGEGRTDDWEGVEVVVSGEKEGSYPDVRFVVNEHGFVHVEVHDLEERPSDYLPPYFSLTPGDSKRRKIFCTYTLWRSTESLCDINRDMVKQFGSYGALITDSEEFLRRVDSAIKKNPTVLGMSAGFVDYFLPDTISDVTPYRKRQDLFGHQNEFRLCAETDNADSPLIFHLYRDLRDIAVPIRTDYFLDSVRLGTNGFYFDRQAIIKL